jgi:hypothetical protein
MKCYTELSGKYMNSTFSKFGWSFKFYLYLEDNYFSENLNDLIDN